MVVRVLSVVVVMILFFSVPAKAEENTITVAPAVIEVAGAPGEEVVRPLTIQNGGEQPLPISFEVQSIINRNNIKKGFIERDASKWIAFEENVIVFEQNQKQQILFKLTIPGDAKPGGYYAQISVRGLALEPVSSSASSIVIPEVTVAVLITIKGEINESIEFDNVQLTPIQATPGSKQDLRFTVRNTGNVHGIITPEFVLEKESIYSTKRLNSQILLPGEEVTYKQDWFVPDDYGVFSASVQSRFGSETKLVESAEETLYVTPSLTKLAILASILWTSMYVLSNKRHVKRAISVLITGS